MDEREISGRDNSPLRVIPPDLYRSDAVRYNDRDKRDSKPYGCDHCGLRFRNPAARRLHWRDHHG